MRLSSELAGAGTFSLCNRRIFLIIIHLKSSHQPRSFQTLCKSSFWLWELWVCLNISVCSNTSIRGCAACWEKTVRGRHGAAALFIVWKQEINTTLVSSEQWIAATASVWSCFHYSLTLNNWDVSIDMDSAIASQWGALSVKLPPESETYCPFVLVPRPSTWCPTPCVMCVGGATA